MKICRIAVKVLLVLQSLTWIAFAAVPQSRHVWLITEENHSYENVMGNMPYLVSLANTYGLASQSYADVHNSISALMHLVAGQTVTGDDNTTLIFNVDNVSARINAAGLTWKAYQESLPFAGDTAIEAYPYVKRHNPLAYFKNTNTSSERVNWVPYPANLDQAQASNFNYVTPNLLHDAHDGTMQAADAWLKQHIPTILARPEFMPGGDGIMIITFDEGNVNTDSRCSSTVVTGCGGRILTVVIGPQVRRGFVSNKWHNHEGVLKTVCEALGLGTCPGAAETANDLGEFFESPAQLTSTCSPATANLTVTLCSPAPSATLTNAVRFQAATTDRTHPVQSMNIYVDNVLRYRAFASKLDTVLTIAPGSHSVVVRAWDSAGTFFSTSASIQVNGCAPLSNTRNVRTCSPEASQTMNDPVHLVASAGGSSFPVTAMIVYVDNVKRFWTSSARIDAFLTLTSGSHSIVTRAWDSSGAFFDRSMVVGTY